MKRLPLTIGLVLALTTGCAGLGAGETTSIEETTTTITAIVAESTQSQDAQPEPIAAPPTTLPPTARDAVAAFVAANPATPIGDPEQCLQTSSNSAAVAELATAQPTGAITVGTATTLIDCVVGEIPTCNIDTWRQQRPTSIQNLTYGLANYQPPTLEPCTTDETDDQLGGFITAATTTNNECLSEQPASVANLLKLAECADNETAVTGLTAAFAAIGIDLRLDPDTSQCVLTTGADALITGTGTEIVAAIADCGALGHFVSAVNETPLDASAIDCLNNSTAPKTPDDLTAAIADCQINAL